MIIVTENLQIEFAGDDVRKFMQLMQDVHNIAINEKSWFCDTDFADKLYRIVANLPPIRRKSKCRQSK